MQIASGLGPLLLLSLGEEFVGPGAPDASSFQALGALLVAERYWAFQMVSITFGIGALILYYMFYQSKLIPRFISVWGSRRSHARARQRHVRHVWPESGGPGKPGRPDAPERAVFRCVADSYRFQPILRNCFWEGQNDLSEV